MYEEMPDQPAARGQVCAVVVTYHPDHDFPARLGRVVPQVAATFIVDNGSSDAEMKMLRGVAAGGATLICNLENLGVAAALNIGARRALAEGFAFQGEMMEFRGSARGEPSGMLPPSAFIAFLQNHD